MKERILVHGGAGPWEFHEEREAEVVAALRKAMDAGLSVMKGGSAVDAVTEAVVLLEDSGLLNAGRGSSLTLAGDIELDAGVMDGESLRAGGVAAVRNVPHPVRLARFVMERTENVLMVGRGAEELARVFGLAGELHPLDMRREEYERDRVAHLESPDHRWVRDLGPRFTGAREGDTVGAVAIDGEGRLAAATSTGGLAFKIPGRVGDSPLVGHGFYAMRGAGAASTSGIGETIARYGLSLRAVLPMRRGTPAQEAVTEAIGELTLLFGTENAGIISLDHRGTPGIAFNTRGMAVGSGCTGINPDGRILRREYQEDFSRLLAKKMRNG